MSSRGAGTAVGLTGTLVLLKQREIIRRWGGGTPQSPVTRHPSPVLALARRTLANGDGAGEAAQSSLVGGVVGFNPHVLLRSRWAGFMGNRVPDAADHLQIVQFLLNLIRGEGTCGVADNGRGIILSISPYSGYHGRGGFVVVVEAPGGSWW